MKTSYGINAGHYYCLFSTVHLNITIEYGSHIVTRIAQTYI